MRQLNILIISSWLTSIYQNLVGLYNEKGLLDDALKYDKKAHKAYMASFGADHSKTKTSTEWISSIVEDSMR